MSNENEYSISTMTSRFLFKSRVVWIKLLKFESNQYQIAWYLNRIAQRLNRIFVAIQIVIDWIESRFDFAHHWLKDAGAGATPTAAAGGGAVDTHHRYANRTPTLTSNLRGRYFVWNWTLPVVMLATVVATTATLSSNSCKSTIIFWYILLPFCGNSSPWMTCFLGNETFRDQDTSVPRHFSTINMVLKCPDSSDMVLKCLKTLWYHTRLSDSLAVNYAGHYSLCCVLPFNINCKSLVHKKSPSPTGGGLLMH